MALYPRVHSERIEWGRMVQAVSQISLSPFDFTPICFKVQWWNYDFCRLLSSRFLFGRRLLVSFLFRRVVYGVLPMLVSSFYDILDSRPVVCRQARMEPCLVVDI
jgi:hypothetical protein